MNPSLAATVATASEMAKAEAANQAVKEQWTKLEPTESRQSGVKADGRGLPPGGQSAQTIPPRSAAGGVNERPNNTTGPNRKDASSLKPGDPPQSAPSPARAQAPGAGSRPEPESGQTATSSAHRGNATVDRPAGERGAPATGPASERTSSRFQSSELAGSRGAAASGAASFQPSELAGSRGAAASGAASFQPSELAGSRGAIASEAASPQGRDAVDRSGEAPFRLSSTIVTTTNENRTIDNHIVSLKNTFETRGAASAARELSVVVHSLPASIAAAYLAKSGTTILQIADRLCSSPSADQNGSRPRGANAAQDGAASSTPLISSAARVLAFAHIASALNSGAGFEATRNLVRELAATMIGSLSPDDEVVLPGLMQNVSIGQGLVLPLAVARELEERNDRRRLRTLYRLIAAALGGTQHRIDTFWSEMEELVGPLIFESQLWRSNLDEESYIRQVNDYLDQNPGFLVEFAERLDRVEQVGREAMRTLDDLATAPSDAVLDTAREALVASQATRLVILHSPIAHREALRMARSRSKVEPEGLTLEAVRLVFVDIGFTAPHDAYLAEAAFTQGFTSPLRAGWTPIANLDAINRDGRTFQRLLGFLNGTFVVETPLAVLALEDVERPAN